MSRNFTPDPILIDQLRLNDTIAFEEVFDRYSHLLYRYSIEKTGSAATAKRIVRDVFVSLWEKREELPVNFSLSLYLYTEVRKAVVASVCKNLNEQKDLSFISQHIIPGFSAAELSKAWKPVQTPQPVAVSPKTASVEHRYAEDWWKNIFPLNFSFKQFRYAMQKVMHLW